MLQKKWLCIIYTPVFNDHIEFSVTPFHQSFVISENGETVFYGVDKPTLNTALQNIWI